MEKSKLLDDYMNENSSNKISKFISKILICLVIILCSLIFTSISDKNLANFKKYVFDNTFNFMEFKSIYEKFSKSNKIVKENNEVKPVFNEINLYKQISYDGKKEVLSINDNEKIKAFSGGIVIYVGNKDNFNKTVIIQGSNGYDIWYGNLDNINVSMYDYIDENKEIGSANKNLYLQITKDDKNYTYDEYKNKI